VISIMVPWEMDSGEEDSLAKRWRSDHLPVGVSLQRNSIPNATETMMMNGITYATRQALWAGSPWLMTRESKMAGMTKLKHG
jgi:hypothetical protein